MTTKDIKTLINAEAVSSFQIRMHSGYSYTIIDKEEVRFTEDGTALILDHARGSELVDIASIEAATIGLPPSGMKTG